MRMSCNGCRVLRKGCSENCSIRPCLQWIKNPESQANATVFLAKFYGRAGLMNLINAGPEHLRPGIFRSLLYEACGRIVNPIYGSVGLLGSGSWQLCHAAVEAVLKGAPIMQIPSETAASTPVPPLKAYDIDHVSKDPDAAAPVPPLKAYDIRHISKDTAAAAAVSRAAAELHRISKSRTRFKRPAAAKRRPGTVSVEVAEPDSGRECNLSWPRCYPVDFQRARSHESAASQAIEPTTAAAVGGGEGDSRESESAFSGESVGASHVSQGEPNLGEESEVGLELTLGFEPVARAGRTVRPAAESRCVVSSWGADTYRMDLGLELPA
ncbi:LOB domain-containing protein 41-like [Phoenix dactylifera]|uniref:LOB domain-containing protein 41-like n=1 Tax=Phoenix dactylifera TaxID=42345 RepID=A0A8B7CPS1_PHODC|nr:LOB domain-containing protein 41-like [Phoenix dactylifera]